MASIDSAQIPIYSRREKGEFKCLPKHESFDKHWGEYHDFVWWTAHKIANRLSGYTADDLIGSLVLLFNKCLYTYDEQKGKLTTYFNFHLQDNVIQIFIRFDSEAWGVRSYAATTTTEEKKKCHIEYAYHEAGNHLYHIPERDTDFIDDVLGCFSTMQEAWDFLVRPLRQRDRDIIRMRFRDGWTLQEIGDKLHITKERVRQLEERALKEIRNRLRCVTAFADMFK